MEVKAGKKTQVREMFNEISGRYDFLNHFLSFGIDFIWRRKAIRMLKALHPSVILDVATGTGDMAILAAKLKPSKIIGIDISENMIEVGRKKIKQRNLEQIIELQMGDSENIPFEDHKFDAAMVAFGVRNFEDLDLGLKEMSRVIVKGGRVVILEFSKPSVFPVKQFYSFYSKYILPKMGNKIAKSSHAYQYLPDSISAFPSGNDFLERLKAAGFSETKQHRLSFGIATIYTGVK